MATSTTTERQNQKRTDRPERIERAKPQLALPDPNLDINQGSLAKWNEETKQACKSLKKGDKLPFDRVRILPMLWTRAEESIAPNGAVIHTSDILPKVTIAIHKLREPIVGDDNKVTYKAVPISIKVPSKSTDGEHITRGFTSEDLIQSIITDPNWCTSYYIWPITDADEDRDYESENSEDYQAALERRKQLEEEVRSQNMQEQTKLMMEA